MGIRVRVIQRGVKPQDMILKVHKKVAKLESAVDSLGHETARQMQQVVRTETYRNPATGTLAGSINAHRIEGKQAFIMGIGRIPDLPIYWYVMNFGQTLQGTPFVPGGGKLVRGDFDGERPDPGLAGSSSPSSRGKPRMTYPGQYAVRAENPVHPKNYIEKTANWLSGNWVSHIRNSGA